MRHSLLSSICPQEDSLNYFLLMQGLLRRRGIPLALYTDRHAVFKHKSEHQPNGTPTQFRRATAELGIQTIFARSPQAKEGWNVPREPFRTG